MKNITDHKYWLAMAIITLIAAAGIGTAVEKINRLQSDIQIFAAQVKSIEPLDYDHKLPLAVNSFLSNPDFKPLINFSFSKADNTANPTGICSPGRVLAELALQRIANLAKPGEVYTGAKYTYPCSNYSRSWENVYTFVFASKGLAYTPKTTNLNNPEDCADASAIATDTERSVYHYLYKDNKVGLLPAASDTINDSGTLSITTDDQAQEALDKSAGLNKAFFSSCTKKH